jgi:plasmid maintenance system antidote protein VapI
MVNDMDTGRKLALLMSIFNVNTRGLARAIHVDPSSVSRWINGKRSLTANSDYLNKIAITSFMSLPLKNKS